MMLQEVPEAGKKLSANLNVAQNIKDVGNLGTKLLDDLGSFQDKLFATVRKDLGLLGVGVETLGKGLTKATDSVVKLGGGLNDAITYFTNINKALGRTTFLTEQAAINVRQLALVGVDDATIASFNKFFDSVGLGVEDATQQQKNLVDEARKYGLNVGAFMTKVNKETEKLTQYGFPKGINDLSKMVAQAQRLGVELGSVSKLADSIMGSPEKAFEIAADLQTLGGAFGQLGDGASLLYDAQNDLPGLQDKIVKAAASIATFNKESGQFEISANERLRLRGLKNLGIDADKIEEAALKLAKNEKILSGFKGVAFDGMSDEDKQTLVNISEVGKGGEIKIGGKGLEELNQAPQTLTKLLEQVQNKGNQLSTDKSNIEVVQSQMSANEQLTTATNQLNTMFASTIITTDNFSKGLDNMANNMTKVGGSMDAFVTKNSVLMTGAYNTALKGSDAIDLAVKTATGGAISEKGLEKPIDIKQEITVKVEGLDVDYANIIKPIIKDYLESRLKKVALKSGYSE